MDKLTMTINEKEYILKSEYDEAIKRLAEYKNNDIPYNIEVTCMDEANVMGIGSVEILNPVEFKFSKVSINYLKRAIKILEEITCHDDPKAKRDSVVLGIGENHPLLSGDIKKRAGENKFSGVIIAPRVE